MSIVVNWRHVLLGARAAVAGLPTSRIARQELFRQDADVFIKFGAYPPPGNAQDTWNPGGPADGQAPRSYHYPVDSPTPLTFVFAFWSYGTKDGRLAGTTGDRSPNLSVIGETTMLDATAWYVRSWPGDGGDNRAFFDAYIERAGGAEIIWLPDDFVTVRPDTLDHQLTTEANNGSISTSFGKTGVNVETVTAASSLPSTVSRPLVYEAPDIVDHGAIDHLPLMFHRWKSAALGGDTLDRLEDSEGTDLKIDKGQNLYAFAVYHESLEFEFRKTISDIFFVMMGTDGPIYFGSRRDLARGVFKVHPVPYPQWRIALIEQPGMRRRVIQWSPSLVLTADHLQQLQQMAGDAARSNDDLAEFLASIAKGKSR